MAQSIAMYEQDIEAGQTGERFRVSFDLVVTDAEALWHAAARIAFRQPGITIAEVEDVLGPTEDPMLAECLAMLTAPDAVPGCTPLGFAVTAVASPHLAQVREHTMRTLAVRDFLAASGVATKQ
ncbi:hypothetical protein [Sphingomonas sp. GC_Shp_3]|uniref:hypothetical protein n=1 Tax=Sphingomonas sp. GC_Shp_3 TaxID=2937383 RepID=UPI00226AB52D|nr:hypothetical protein [Sphingomonas sp. GC_Shp_3]